MVQARDVDTQAIFSLKGKPLNCYGLKRDAIYKNEELYNIMRALGIEDSSTGCATNRVVIATDADVDGMHIRNLLLTYFLRYFEELVIRGHVYILETPLFRVRNKKDDRYCYNEVERERPRRPSAGRRSRASRGSVRSRLASSRSSSGPICGSSPYASRRWRGHQGTRVLHGQEHAGVAKDFIVDHLITEAMLSRKKPVAGDQGSLPLEPSEPGAGGPKRPVTTIEPLMRRNFLEYASYFIVDRAIPDLRDGCKPVQRRHPHTRSSRWMTVASTRWPTPLEKR